MDVSHDSNVTGHLEGEVCNRAVSGILRCNGIIEEREVEGCSCHLYPPCPECLKQKEWCPECGWDAEQE